MMLFHAKGRRRNCTIGCALCCHAIYCGLQSTAHGTCWRIFTSVKRHTSFQNVLSQIIIFIYYNRRRKAKTNENWGNRRSKAPSSFCGSKESQTGFDTLEYLAVLVEAIPAHPSVFPLAIVFFLAELLFFSETPYFRGTGQVKETVGVRRCCSPQNSALRVLLSNITRIQSLRFPY